MNHDTETVVKRSPLTIIVAEKYPIARAALAALLRYDGYRVFQAERFEPVISLIDRAEDFAALLLDLDMPGWKTIVRHAAKRADALVIGMEGKQHIDRDELSGRGIKMCFEKPINYEDLRAAIKEERLPNNA